MAGLAWQNEGPFTLTAGEDLAADRLVLMSSSTAIYADAAERPLGVTQRAVSSGGVVSIRPLTGGVIKVTGSKSISAGSAIYTTTDGKVSDAAGGGSQIGVLLEAITGSGGKGAAVVWQA